MRVQDRSPHLRSVLLAVLAVAALAACTPSVEATQHLVNPGEEWQFLVDKVRPGDDIVLLPGRHRPAILDRLQGETDRPITIRGAAADRPAVIAADNWGLVLRDARHVVLQDLLIRGAKIAGVVLGPSDQAGGENAAPARPGDVTLRRVGVLRTAGELDRDSFIAEGIDGLLLDTCRFDGWGGAAVRLLDCRGTELRECRFAPIDQLEHERCISVEQGSIGVRIVRCRFEVGLRTGIAIGLDSSRAIMRRGVSPQAESNAAPEAPPAVASDAEPPTVATGVPAVRDVTVEQCMFEGLETPIAFGSVANAAVRFCTMLRPQGCFIRFVQPWAGATNASDIVLGGNLFYWTPNDMPSLVEVQNEHLGDGAGWEENLWWSAEHAVLKQDRLPLPGRELLPQLLDVDPKLDTRYRPEATAAQGFGVQPLPRP